MRVFALDCLRWAEFTDNASHRDLMLRVAKTWMNTASAIEQRGTNGDALASTESGGEPDLRQLAPNDCFQDRNVSPPSGRPVAEAPATYSPDVSLSSARPPDPA
jgi:hypothetical protein